MKKPFAVLLLAVSAVVSTQSHAAPLEVVSLTDTAESLQIAWWWDTSMSLDDDVTALSNWNVNLTLFAGGEGQDPVINVYGRHEANPHSHDQLPAMSFSAVLSPGMPRYINTVPHQTTNPHSHHLDTFTFTATPLYPDGKSFLLMTAVHAVPEPETYAMMLVGLGVLGGLWRRRLRGR